MHLFDAELVMKPVFVVSVVRMQPDKYVRTIEGLHTYGRTTSRAEYFRRIKFSSIRI